MYVHLYSVVFGSINSILIRYKRPNLLFGERPVTVVKTEVQKLSEIQSWKVYFCEFLWNFLFGVKMKLKLILLGLV